jgi:peptide/nickel transport system ATP-binding protein
MSEPRPLLAIRDLHVSYGSGRHSVEALRGVSLDVAPGETVGLVGESGSGKTTIARAVLGLAPVAGGTIELAGKDITTRHGASRRELARAAAVVFQDPYSSLNPALKIGATLAEPFRATRGATAAEARARAASLLERVGIEAGAADRYPSSFSGGQRQRIAIARALMSSPELVICDEAVSALDLSVQAQVLNLLRSLQREFELSFLFIGHDLDVVRYMSHRVVVVYRGRVLEHGPAEVVARSPRHPYTQALVAAKPGRGKLVAAAAGARARSDLGAPGGGCPFEPRCRYVVARCAGEVPELQQAAGGGAAACHRLEDLPALVASGPSNGHRAARGAPERSRLIAPKHTEEETDR